MLGSSLYLPYGHNEIQKGEHGITLYFYVGEDVSGKANTILIRSPRYTLTEKAASVDGSEASASTTGSIAFPANQYVSYTLQDGDIDYPGDWFVRVVSKDSDERKTKWARLKVTN